MADIHCYKIKYRETNEREIILALSSDDPEIAKREVESVIVGGITLSKKVKIKSITKMPGE